MGLERARGIFWGGWWAEKSSCLQPWGGGESLGLQSRRGTPEGGGLSPEEREPSPVVREMVPEGHDRRPGPARDYTRVSDSHDPHSPGRG